MKRLTTIIITLLFLAAPVAAESFVVLEALVQSHKSMSNKLRDRNNIEISVLGATNMTTNRTEEYQDNIIEMQKRIEGSFASVQFASDLAVLSSMAVKVARLSEDAVDFALDNATDNPLIIPATVKVVERTGQCVNTIYRLVAMVASSGTGVVLATNEDRTQFCFMIRTKLYEIQQMMESLLQMSLGTDFIKMGNTLRHRQLREILNGSQHGIAADKVGEMIDQAANEVR